jgi:hypothetical protein
VSTLRRSSLSIASFSLLALMFLLVSYASAADTAGGQTICLGRYALCSHAKCERIANDPGHVKCTCEGPLNGLNIANSSCQSRAQNLISTFSLKDLGVPDSPPAKRSLACTGDNAHEWAFCLDAPCNGNSDSGTVSCTCKLSLRSNYYTFAKACPANAKELHSICGEIWSAAELTELISGYSQLWSFYADTPKLEYCPVDATANSATDKK